MQTTKSRPVMPGFVRRNPRKIVITWLFVSAVGVAVTFLTPDVYRAEARLFVRLGRENVTLDPTATMGQGPISAVPTSREGEINSVVEILKGRLLVERTVDQLTPQAILADQASLMDQLVSSRLHDPREAAISRLGKRIDVSAIRKSDLISVSCDANDPELGRTAVAKFIEAFLDQYRTLYRDPLARGFFAEQTRLLAADLQRTETEMLALRNKTGVSSVEEQRRLLLGLIGSLEDELLKTSAQIKGSEAQINDFEKQLATLPRTVITNWTNGFPNVAADSNATQLYSLKLRERELSARFTDEYFLVKQVREQLKAAQGIQDREQKQRTQVTEGLSRPRDEVQVAFVLEQSRLKALRARASTLESQAQESRGRLAALNDADIQVARLQRQLDLQRANFLKYSESLEHVRMDRALAMERISNINIVQPPSVDLQAVRPNRPLMVTLSAIFATLAACGVGLLAEQLAPTTTSFERRALPAGVPIEAPVPHFSTKAMSSAQPQSTL